MAIFNGKIHYQWPFSIATLNYQRVIFDDLNTFKPDISHEFQSLLGKRPSVYRCVTEKPFFVSMEKPQVPAHGRLRLPPQKMIDAKYKKHILTPRKKWYVNELNQEKTEFLARELDLR